MKKFVLILALCFPILADDNRSVSFEPCESWWYDFDANGYICRYKGFRTTVYTSQEVNQIVSELKSKISALENRVKTLEAKQ